jgi:outer membrane protein TolC
MRFLLPFLSLSLVAQAPLPAPAPERTVEDAVRSALERQPRLKAAVEQREAADARHTQAQLDRVGKLEADLLYTPWQKPLEVTFPGLPPLIPPANFEIKTLQTWSLQGAWTQPLWTWGALEKKARSAKEEFAAADHQMQRARQQTIFEATKTFLQAAEAEEAVKVAQQALEQQQEFLRVAAARVRAGGAPKLDELKAELGVAQAQSQLLESRNAAKLAREALVTTTLDPRFRTDALKLPEQGAGTVPEQDASVRRALDQRPDLKGLRRQAAALDLGSQAAKGSGLPSLSFRASIVQQNETLGTIWNKEGQQYTAGFVLAWEGFSPFRARAKAAELRANAKAVTHQAEAAEEGVALEVRSALQSLREAWERLQVQDHAVTVAEEQARIARLAYREGVITSVDLQQAELGLSDARFRRLKAGLDASLAQAALHFALGD